MDISLFKMLKIKLFLPYYYYKINDLLQKSKQKKQFIIFICEFSKFVIEQLRKKEKTPYSIV